MKGTFQQNKYKKPVPCKHQAKPRVHDLSVSAVRSLVFILEFLIAIVHSSYGNLEEEPPERHFDLDTGIRRSNENLYKI